VVHQRRGDAEGHEIRQRVELAAERTAHVGAAGGVAVDRVERGGDQHREEGGGQAAVLREHDREEAGRQAARGEEVREVQVGLHGTDPAGR